MKILKLIGRTELKIKNIKGFLKREVVISGTSAKVNCPKEYLGSKEILIILENELGKRSKILERRGTTPKKRKRTTKKLSRKTN